MKVKEFINWLEQQNQNLEVCVIQVGEGYDGEGEYYKEPLSVCFDDPKVQSRQTKLSLILGSDE